MSVAPALETPVDRLLRALADHGVRSAGSDRWSSRCPGHPDANPSLSIGVGNNGGAIIHCHTGCKPEDVLAAVGLRLADLMPPREDRPARRDSRGPGEIVAEWAYYDAKGTLLRQKTRHRLAGGKKTYRWWHPEADGALAAGMGDAPHTLYRLPELQAAPHEEPVLIVEGEKCCDRARALGFVATTSGGGADGTEPWTDPAFTEALRGRAVVIVPDTDRPGARFAEAVAGALINVAASVKVVSLPRLAPSEDIVEWVDQRGGSKDELLALIANTPREGDPGALRQRKAEELRERVGPLSALADLLKDPGPRLATGIATLDRACDGGLPAGTRLLVLGKPGASKTTFGITVALGWARLGHRVVVLAIDEGARKIAVRLGQAAGLSRKLLQDGDDAERDRLRTALGEFPDLTVLDAARGYTIEDAILLLAGRPDGVAGVLLIDSLQKAAWSMPGDSTRAKVDALLGRVVTATEADGLIALVTSEVNRGSYASKNPDDWVDGMAAGKESGGIEFAADVQIVLTPPPDGVGSVRAKIEKNRLGQEKVTFLLAVDKVGARVSEVESPADDGEVARDPEQAWAKYETIVRTRLAEFPNGLPGGRKALIGLIGRRAGDISVAISRLLSRGEIVDEKGPRNSRVLRLATVFPVSSESLPGTESPSPGCVSSPTKGRHPRKTPTGRHPEASEPGRHPDRVPGEDDGDEGGSE